MSVENEKVTQIKFEPVVPVKMDRSGVRPRLFTAITCLRIKRDRRPLCEQIAEEFPDLGKPKLDGVHHFRRYGVRVDRLWDALGD